MTTELTTIDPSVVSANTARVAESLGYQGALTIGALEDEIRFYQQRTIEDMFELGKRLLILKEMTPHSEFIKRLEILGFNTRTVQRFMQATLKFSKASSPTLLNKVGNQSKLLELLVLDDEEVEALSSGESVVGITLDDIETMSSRELRKALRDARADATAKDEVLANKNKKIDELDAKLSLRKQPDQAKLVADEAEARALQQMQQAVVSIIGELNHFSNSMQTALKTSDSDFVSEQYQSNLRLVYQNIAQRLRNNGIPIDFESQAKPVWFDKKWREDNSEQDEKDQSSQS